MSILGDLSELQAQLAVHIKYTINLHTHTYQPP
jgi:hypothetical protein